MTFRRIDSYATDDPKKLDGQLSRLEDNIAAALESLPQPPMKLSLVGTSIINASVILKPGQLAGFNTALGDITVAIAAPRPGDAGKFLAVIKEEGANTLTLTPPAGVLIEAATTYATSSQGLILLLCEGNNYWVV
jgi:hypothetical protein